MIESRELLRGVVGVRCRRALDDALELLDLLALDVFEAGADPLACFGLFASDPLHQLALAHAHPLVEFVERAPPLGGVRLDLGPRGTECTLERLVELSAHTLDGCAQFLALGGQAIAVGCEARFDLDDELLLALRQLRDVQLRRLGRTVEILRPAGEPLLDLRLRRRERLRERRCDGALALGELAPMILGQLALFFDERRDGVGACARQCPLELGAALRGLAIDEREQLIFRLLEMSVDRIGADERAAKRDRRRRGEQTAGQAPGCDRELAHVRPAEREDEPARTAPGELERRERDAALRSAETAARLP